jgi:hypothetical protein
MNDTFAVTMSAMTVTFPSTPHVGEAAFRPLPTILLPFEDDEFVAVGVANNEFTVAPRPIFRFT